MPVKGGLDFSRPIFLTLGPPLVYQMGVWVPFSGLLGGPIWQVWPQKVPIRPLGRSAWQLLCVYSVKMWLGGPRGYIASQIPEKIRIAPPRVIPMGADQLV